MKHPYIAKLLFLLLLAGLSFTTRAQAQTGSVSGKVLDNKGSGIPGATVLIEGSTLGSSSNVDGAFNITNVPAGPRTLVISFVGYTSSRIPVTVVAGQNATAGKPVGKYYSAGRGSGGGLRHPASAGYHRGRDHD